MPHFKKDDILLSRFALRDMIGQGGMGQVWLVWDRELEIQIAAKILNPQLMSDPNRVSLLKNECRNTRRLAHPNIVRVFDFHRTEDLAFISMEYVDGPNMAIYRRRFEQINTSQIIQLIKPVVNALGYAHGMGLVHRDVKAGNILVDRQQTPRLTDFGIAGVFKSGHNALDITSGGSLFCMSPQQLDGQRPAPSDDIYALGVLLYEMFTGYPPFYPDITRDRIRQETPAPVNQRLRQLAVDANISDPMEKLISGMLAKMPAERPAGMREIEERLDRILSPGGDRTPGPARPTAADIAARQTSDRSEMITPLKVTPITVRKGLSASTRGNLIKGAALVAAFVFLLAGGFWLWHYLAGRGAQPLRSDKPPGETPQAAQKKTPELPPAQPDKVPDPAGIAAEKEQAEQKLAAFMQLKQQLEASGVSLWGNEMYRQMSQLADEADRLLIERNYIAAAEKYTGAAARARELVDRMAPTLKQLLDEGQMALDEGSGKLAEEKFTTALLIDPENRLARDNLQRAKNTDAVMRLLASGNQHENAGKIYAARADYQEALRLDSASKNAGQALARVNSQISEQEFQQLMSEGLTALHSNNYQLASTKLRKAQAYRPESREVKDALTQVDQAIRLSRIETHRSQAAAAERSEKWQQALDAYQQVLKIDANVQFAVQGKQSALKRIQIDERLNFFLQQPAVLESDRQLENALQLIDEIEAIDSKGPRLKDQHAKLVRIVDAAKTPVKVILESDTFTEVAVYKVGKLGRFATRELSLRPGSYTVVGTRDGYQDVRKKIIIKPEQGPTRVTIRCEVKI